MSTIISNPKLSTSSSKISPDARKRFSMSTINNKHVRSAPILRSILKISASNIGILSYSSCWRVKNPDANNESNKNIAEIGIKLEDEMN